MQPINYFELLNLPESYDVDEQALERAYFEKQRECHPDRFVGAGTQASHNAMQLSVDVNQAYQTLKSPLLRAEYMLERVGVVVTGEEATMKPSMQLLENSMAQREALMEAETAEDFVTLSHQTQDAADRDAEAFAKAYDAKDYETAGHHVLSMRYHYKFLDEIQAREGMARQMKAAL